MPASRKHEAQQQRLRYTLDGVPVERVLLVMGGKRRFVWRTKEGVRVEARETRLG